MTELKPCPFCGGYAEFDDDEDGSFILKVWHHQDCPACMQSDSKDWSTWFYCEDFGDGSMSREQAKADVAEWWNMRVEPKQVTLLDILMEDA